MSESDEVWDRVCRERKSYDEAMKGLSESALGLHAIADKCFGVGLDKIGYEIRDWVSVIIHAKKMIDDYDRNKTASQLQEAQGHVGGILKTLVNTNKP